VLSAAPSFSRDVCAVDRHSQSVCFQELATSGPGRGNLNGLFSQKQRVNEKVTRSIVEKSHPWLK
jgi:hypothetical protein